MTWRLSFLAPAKGDYGPKDPVFLALQKVASVESRSTPRIDSKTSAVHGNLAEFVVDVEADDVDRAKKIVEDAVAPHGGVSGGTNAIQASELQEPG